MRNAKPPYQTELTQDGTIIGFIAFSAAFYMALGHGRSVQTAFDVGANELELHSIPSASNPILLVGQGVDSGVTLLGGADR